MASNAQQLLLFPVLMGTDGYVNNMRRHAPVNRIKHPDVGDSGSETDRDDQDPSISDCESGICGTPDEESRLFDNDGLIKVSEDDRLHQFIENRFISGLCSVGEHAKVQAIHRNSFSTFLGQARLQSFQIFSKALEKKRGDANLKYAWYGASKDEISKIISHGFAHCGKSENNGLHRCGITLSPANYPIESVRSSIIDKDGIMHVLLCRVLLGKMELVCPDSGQCYPSSEEFDSRVDNLLSPNKYIIWSAHMNTHILPEFVISFKAFSDLGGCHIRNQFPLRRPTSPWMPISNLIAALSKFLPPDAIRMITKHHNDFRGKRICRQELIRQVRQIAGDKLLTAIIKSYRDKEHKASFGASSNNNSSKFCGRNPARNRNG